MDRRYFIALGMAAGSVPFFSPSYTQDAFGNETDLSELADIPNFCSHEHWGSISAIGHAAEGFKADVVAGASPNRKTTLIDLVIEPYFSGCLGPARKDLDAAVMGKPGEMMRRIRPVIEPHQLTGTYQCTRIGILKAYGYDINSDTPPAAIEADEAIGINYSDIFGWYRRAMKKFNFSELIRPVHPEFYVRKESNESAGKELSFTNTIMRIDPFMSLWKKDSDRRRSLSQIAGVEPCDAKSWREFLDNIFEISAKKGNTGIKQLQAYSRPLHFERHDDSAVKFIGDLGSDEVRVFQDWVMHECCKRANDRRWPHQVHVGTHNLPDSNPLPLQHLGRQYPRQKIVMLHCWPYLDECGYLAKNFANMHIDTCWQPVLNPEFLRKALQLWINYVPTTKIMMGNDATTIEMAVGSSHFGRTILAKLLSKTEGTAGMPQSQRRNITASLLHNNAVEMYGIGQQFQS